MGLGWRGPGCLGWARGPKHPNQPGGWFHSHGDVKAAGVCQQEAPVMPDPCHIVAATPHGEANSRRCEHELERSVVRAIREQVALADVIRTWPSPDCHRLRIAAASSSLDTALCRRLGLG